MPYHYAMETGAMKFPPRWVIIIILLAVVLGTTVWQKRADKLPASQVLYGDTDANGRGEKYLLKNRQLQVWEDSQPIWQTPKEWQIKQIVLADADNNGKEELLLVIWKKGSFGKSKPFWFKGADDQFSCHLFVYRLMAGKMKAVWCSSALQHPIIKLDVADSNADGLNELQVSEGPGYGFAYELRQYFSRRDTRWVWNGWGFERVDS